MRYKDEIIDAITQIVLIVGIFVFSYFFSFTKYDVFSSVSVTAMVIGFGQMFGAIFSLLWHILLTIVHKLW